MAVKWTEEQEQVIALRDRNLLVSAAAGSGKTAVLDCRLGAHIAPEGFAGWNDRTDTALAGFAETGSTGAGAGERPGWVQAFSAAEAAALLRTARQKCRMETTERITE